VGHSLVDAREIGDIEDDGLHARADLVGGGFALGLIPGAQQDGATLDGQLANDLTTDAAIGAGDEGAVLRFAVLRLR